MQFELTLPGCSRYAQGAGLERRVGYRRRVYRFALRPRWVLGHVVVIVLVVLFVSLGGWQLRRLDDKRAHNDVLRERSTTVVELPTEGWSGEAATSDLAFRRVRAVGRYDAASEVLVRYRSHDGAPGYHVLTPFHTAHGVVIVNRGWVPMRLGEQWPAPDAAPRSGEVEISGLLLPTEGPARLPPSPAGSPSAVAGPRAPMFGAVHIPELERHLGHELYDLSLQLDRTSDASPSYPVALSSPSYDESRHLSYALQWFVFAAGAFAGWLVLVRKTAIERSRPKRASGRTAEDAVAAGTYEGGCDEEDYRPKDVSLQELEHPDDGNHDSEQPSEHNHDGDVPKSTLGQAEPAGRRRTHA